MTPLDANSGLPWSASTSARLASIAMAALLGAGCATSSSTEPLNRAITAEDGTNPDTPTGAAPSPTSVASPSLSYPRPTTPDDSREQGDDTVTDTPEPPADQVTIVPFDEHPYDELNRGADWRFSLRSLSADRYEYAFFNTEFPGFVVRHVLESRQEGVYDLGDPECPWSDPIVFLPFDASAAGSARTTCVTRQGRPIVREQTVTLVSSSADAIRYRISSEEYTEWSDGPQTTFTIDDYVFDRSLGWHEAWRSTIRREDDDGISGPFEYRYMRRSTEPAN